MFRIVLQLTVFVIFAEYSVVFIISTVFRIVLQVVAANVSKMPTIKYSQMKIVLRQLR